MVGLVVTAATVVVAVRSPYGAGTYGTCPSVLGLGAWCPGCGGLRAVHDLVRGDVVGAWTMNQVIVLAAAVLVALWSLWLRAALRGTAVQVRAPGWVAWGALVAVVLFGVLRNVPTLVPWIAPGGQLPPFLTG